MKRQPGRTLIILFFVVVPCCASARGDDFPTPINTQVAGEHPPAPEEMPALFDLPDGFCVTLFAGEPDVQQPIAFDFDDRGRVWVAENYTYSGHGAIDANQRDRIIILTDNDGDGRHDKRRVFWDTGRMLTGLTWGRGGIWILNDGTLSFIPDRNGDDVPDSEPVVMLDGWTQDAGHNFVNGLLWGPDGWLYGRHGILDTSWPGTPGTPREQRSPINCGIWRFHPTKHHFEVVCHGTTNPWGMDYNEHGQLFMTNNVIAHLWHVIPGAHYERMFGQDFNPHLYELMGPCSDHYHWDTAGEWTDSRGGAADVLGGGHSHCGGMIYLGRNFPQKYRGRMFTCNTHGRSVNVDRLERAGSGYVGKHEPNFLKVNSTWFRGIELKEGPAGCVWLSDWSDNGECHDHDGVHRTSGRIYRISCGDAAESAMEVASALSEAETESLIATALESPSEWLRRRAARQLTEQQLSADMVQTIVKTATSGIDELPALNAAWLLHATDNVSAATCKQLLESRSEHARALAVRMIGEMPRLQAGGLPLATWARLESSPLVQMAWASAVRQMPVDTGRSVMVALAENTAVLHRLEDDPQLRKMTWYAIEHCAERGTFPVELSDPTLLRYIYRRQASTDWNAARIEATRFLTTAAVSREERETTISVLSGLLDGLRGQRRVAAPDNWEAVAVVLRQRDDPEINALTDELSVLFGDGVALEKIRELVGNRAGDHTARSQAIRILAQARDEAAVPLLLSLLNDRAVYGAAVRALAVFDDPRIPTALLSQWNGLQHGSREAAVNTLVSRLTYAQELAEAIEDARVEAAELSAVQVRQLLSFSDPDIRSTIESHWGVLRDSPAAKAQAISVLKERLTDDVLHQADWDNGMTVFRKTCGACHKLYGEGGTIGPDLTGANRTNMDYLLNNIIDPSAEVARQHTLSVIALTSGRVINGVILSEIDQSVVVQTEKEQVTIAIKDIEERVQTNQSLMPDGLLDSMSDDAIRDLIAWLRRID